MELEWKLIVNRARWALVQHVGCCSKRLSSVGGWHGGMNQQGAYSVIGGMNHALSFAVLWRGVRTRKMKQNATTG